MRFVAFLLALSIAPFTPQPVEQSIVHLKSRIGEDGMSCSAVSIKEELGNFLSSLHCLGENLLVNGSPAQVLMKDENHDLMLVTINKPSGIPPIRLGGNPTRFTSTRALGYAFATDLLLSIPTTFQGELEFEGEENSGVFIGNTVGGMSGGAIVNSAGQLVGLVKGGGKVGSPYQWFGLGVPYAAVRKLYLEGQF